MNIDWLSKRTTGFSARNGKRMMAGLAMIGSLGAGTLGMSAAYNSNVGHSLLTTGTRYSAKALSESRARELIRPTYPQLYHEARLAGQPVIDHIPRIFKINEYEKGITGEYAKPIPFLEDYMHIRTSAPDVTKAVGHELRHAFQAKAMGSNSAFDKAYAEDTKKFGYKNNRFELDANAFEGRIANHIPEEIRKEALEHFDKLPYRKPDIMITNMGTKKATNLVEATNNTLSRAYKLLSKVLK
jgi:hypothetical protein